MKRTKIFAFATCCLLAAATARSDDSYRSTDNNDQPLFRPQELSVDLFGSGSVGQSTLDHLSGDRLHDNGRLGAGVGVNMFFTRQLGIGVDAITENTADSIVDYLSGNLILRFPIDKAHMAPYIYGGGGRQFDPRDLWFGQGGAGVDIRITRHFGLFADGRYVFTDGTENFALARGGLRIVF